MTYTYKALDKSIKEKLISAQYSREELDSLVGDVRNEIAAGKARMKKVDVFLALFYAVTVIASFANEKVKHIGAILAACLLCLPFFALGRAVACWHSYGYMRWQFKSALKKGYPDLAGQYTL